MMSLLSMIAVDGAKAALQKIVSFLTPFEQQFIDTLSLTDTAW